MQLYIHCKQCEERETDPSLNHDVNTFFALCGSMLYSHHRMLFSWLELLYIRPVYSYTWLMSLTSAAKISPLSPLSYLQLGATALHMAAQEGKADVVRLLAEAGAQLDIHATDVSFCFHNNYVHNKKCEQSQ